MMIQRPDSTVLCSATDLLEYDSDMIAICFFRKGDAERRKGRAKAGDVRMYYGARSGSIRKGADGFGE